ncbi:sensor histidine kinase [Cohnella silvisoli]|uniref:histidine kinase n=1 Tax=Cohnella silvisoli TaxID=2873699 RepID=A0ABV1KS77_9BACL|nr:HAMP domain-containing sensor histidine kinase [Cohnella silvisoli]MCD9022668.1 HAMP domain-containing histidine kinase [Cohnella silvisoli]
MERIEGSRLSLARMRQNPSVRRLCLILAALIVLAIVFIGLYTHYSTEKLKKDWLNREAAIIGNLSAERPELAASWLNELAQTNKPSPEAVAEGRKIMESHGITAELETRWLPVIGEYRIRTWWVLLIGVIAFITLAALLLLRESRRQLGEIRSLAVSLEDTVKHNKPMAFRSYEEGELGLLANGAQELTIRLRETIEQLHEDKAFLKDTVADISHQLKTPLASLMIYVDLLREGQVDAEHAAEFLETCRRELDRMEWLTLTLLKLARLEADALEMNLSEAPIANTVREAVNSIRHLAENKQIKVVIEEADTRLIVPHDSRWMAEALVNVLKNAVEHSPPGSSVFVGWENTPVFTRLHVKDQGRGIEARHLPHIFKKFYRTSSDSNGVGLGLPLVKSIVEKHGGIVSAAGNPSGGTTFILTLLHHPFPPASSKLTKL